MIHNMGFYSEVGYQRTLAFPAVRLMSAFEMWRDKDHATAAACERVSLPVMTHQGFQILQALPAHLTDEPATGKLHCRN